MKKLLIFMLSFVVSFVSIVNVVCAGTYDYEAIREYLVGIGMDAECVYDMSEEDLIDYFNATDINTVTIYQKSDCDGNIETITEQEAMITPANYVSDTVSKVKIVLTTARLSANTSTYKFSIDITYLSGAQLNRFDSIGICAQNISIVNTSRKGFVKYTDTINGVQTEIENEFTAGAKSNCVKGNWYGSVGKYITPQWNTDGTAVVSNLRAHYHFNANPTSPSLESYFSIVGSYSHKTITVSVSPSVSIDLGKPSGVSASLGFEFGSKEIRHCVETQVHYVPGQNI